MPTLKQGLVTAAISALTTAVIFGTKWAGGKAINAINRRRNAPPAPPAK
jgi:hypothetical protein